MKWAKIIISITVLIIIFVIFLSQTNETSQIFVGNSYENSKDLNVTLIMNDAEVLYDGFLKSQDLPFLVKDYRFEIGIYKVTAYLKSSNKKIETKFFYLFQKSIWIDFDMTQKNPLLVNGYYKLVPI